jgi:hypothetical protein
MANDNIKRYLDYDGLAYLINKFNSVIEANEYTTSEALNDLNKKIAELNFNDNTGGFPIIDADITQVDSVYTTTENLNELITPGQYIVDSSKIQYEEDNFVKTLYWLLSVDKVVYDNSESIVQTYYPLSYLSYNWYNIPIGGLLQRFYEGNNTWTDLQLASPGDVDPTKYVTKNEFDTNINTINTSINNINTSINNINTSVNTINEEIVDINETIKGLSKTDNDTKCTSATINVADAPEASTNEVDVISKQQITLSGTGESLETKQSISSVKVVTKKYVDENFTTKSERDSIWEAINSGRVDSITLEKSGTKVTKDSEEVDIPFIDNKINFYEAAETGYYVGKFDVISLPTKKYVSNNYVSNQTLSTTLNDYVNKTLLNNYVDKASVIPNILKNGVPQAYGDKDNSLQWYQTSKAITDTNSINYTDICAPSYSDFNETSALGYNINSMVIRAFWNSSYFHDIWMSPNSNYIFHRSIDNKIAKPWKILLDNENCGKYVKRVVNNNIIDIANFKTINIPLSTKEGLEIPDGKAIIGTNILDLSTVLDQSVRNIHSTPADSWYNEYTDLSIILNNSIDKRNENQNLYSLSESLSIGYYDVSKNKNVRIGSFYTYTCTGRAQGRFDLDAELCVHANDNSYLLFEHDTTNASANHNTPRQGHSNGTFTVKSYEQNYITDNFYIRHNNFENNIFKDPDSHNNLVHIHSGSATFSIPVYFNNSVSINNSKNIYFGSSYNSNNLPDFGDIIYSGNIKVNNEDNYHELGRIFTDYSSNNYLSFKIRRTEGLDENNIPILKDYTLIDSGNILSKLPSTVITTNNIPSHISSSNSFKFKDSGGALIEYVVHSEPGNVLSTQQLGVNTDYNVICRPDHINTWNNYNIVSSHYNTQLLRLKFGTTFFHDIFVDPNSEYIMHRSVRSNTAFDWQLLLDTNNISKWFGSTLPGSADMVDKVTATIITGKNIKPASIAVTGNINVGGGVYETSDETLKDFQDSIQVNFEQLKEIPKAYFTFKDDKTGETKIGTSAQKVKEFYPELVSEDENGILSVDYAKLSMVALKAVDELDNRISKLEKLVIQLLENK